LTTDEIKVGDYYLGANGTILRVQSVDDDGYIAVYPFSRVAAEWWAKTRVFEGMQKISEDELSFYLLKYPQ